MRKDRFMADRRRQAVGPEMDALYDILAQYCQNNPDKLLSFRELLAAAAGPELQYDNITNNIRRAIRYKLMAVGHLTDTRGKAKALKYKTGISHSSTNKSILEFYEEILDELRETAQVRKDRIDTVLLKQLQDFCCENENQILPFVDILESNQTIHRNKRTLDQISSDERYALRNKLLIQGYLKPNTNYPKGYFLLKNKTKEVPTAPAKDTMPPKEEKTIQSTCPFTVEAVTVLGNVETFGAKDVPSVIRLLNLFLEHDNHEQISVKRQSAETKQ